MVTLSLLLYNATLGSIRYNLRWILRTIFKRAVQVLTLSCCSCSLCRSLCWNSFRAICCRLRFSEKAIVATRWCLWSSVVLLVLFFWQSCLRIVSRPSWSRISCLSFTLVVHFINLLMRGDILMITVEAVPFRWLPSDCPWRFYSHFCVV